MFHRTIFCKISFLLGDPLAKMIRFICNFCIMGCSILRILQKVSINMQCCNVGDKQFCGDKCMFIHETSFLMFIFQ